MTDWWPLLALVVAASLTIWACIIFARGAVVAERERNYRYMRVALRARALQHEKKTHVYTAQAFRDLAREFDRSDEP